MTTHTTPIHDHALAENLEEIRAICREAGAVETHLFQTESRMRVNYLDPASPVPGILWDELNVYLAGSAHVLIAVFGETKP